MHSFCPTSKVTGSFSYRFDTEGQEMSFFHRNITVQNPALALLGEWDDGLLNGYGEDSLRLTQETLTNSDWRNGTSFGGVSNDVLTSKIGRAHV